MEGNMPKGIKGAAKQFENELNKAGDKLENLAADKYERAENCLNVGIDFCNKNTGSKVTFENMQSLSFERIDPVNESLQEYCTIQFSKHDIIPCNELHQSASTIDEL